MNKRKVFLSIWTLTLLIWLVALIRFEFFLIQLSNYNTGSYGYLFGGFDVPFMVHLIVLLTIISLAIWLWTLLPELLSLYSKQLVTAKTKIHEITAEKPETKEPSNRDEANPQISDSDHTRDI